MLVELSQQGMATIESIGRKIWQLLERWWGWRAHGRDRVVVVFRLTGNLWVTDREERVILASQVATKRSCPPQCLGVSRKGWHHHVTWYVFGADVQVLADRTHAGVIRPLGKVVFSIATTIETGQDVVGIMAVVFVGIGTNECGPVHDLGGQRQQLADLKTRYRS